MAPTKFDTKEDFETMMDFCFTTTVEEAPESAGIPRSEFWKRAYFERLGQCGIRGKSVFRTFLRHPTWHFLLVTGHVGTGKSTFVYEKIENSKLCGGLIIDFQNLRSTIPEVSSEEEFLHTLPTIMQEEIESALHDHFVRIRREHPCAADYRSPGNERLSSPINVTQDEDAWATANTLATFLLPKNDSGLARIRRNLYSISKDPEPPEDHKAEFERLSEIIHSQPCTHDEINEQTTLERWLRAYFEFFRFRFPVVFFDNMDASRSFTLQPAMLTFITRLRPILKTCAASTTAHPNKRTTPLVIFAVREENLGRLDYENAGTSNFLTIVLGARPNALPPGDRTYIFPLDTKLLDAIIIKRLEFADHFCPPEWKQPLMEYATLLKFFWAPDEDESVIEEESRNKSFHLRDLNNHSIRLSLNMAFQATFEFVKRLRLTKRDIGDFCTKQTMYALRGGVIRWLLRTYNHTEYAYHDILGAKTRVIADADPCCLYRLILIYLINATNPRRKCFQPEITVKHVIEALREVNDLGEEHDHQILNAISWLFGAMDIHGAFLVVHQNRPVRPDSIDLDARVRITTRGMVLVQNINLHIDYWGTFLHDKFHDVLFFESKPEKASKYAEAVTRQVSDIAVVHIESWCKRVAQRFCPEHTAILPFPSYWDKFALKDAFFMERVSNSHINSIRAYIRCLLRAPELLVVSSEEAGNRWQADFLWRARNGAEARNYRDFEARSSDWLGELTSDYLSRPAASEPGKEAVRRFCCCLSRLTRIQKCFQIIKQHSVEKLEAIDIDTIRDLMRLSFEDENRNPKDSDNAWETLFDSMEAT